MIVVFTQDYLKELFEKGVCSDKKHRFQPTVVKGFRKAISYLLTSSRKEDLFLIRSLHFESLKGDRAGMYSVRVDLKYRIEFTIDESNDLSTLSICNIVELSNHYK